MAGTATEQIGIELVMRPYVHPIPKEKPPGEVGFSKEGNRRTLCFTDRSKAREPEVLKMQMERRKNLFDTLENSLLKTFATDKEYVGECAPKKPGQSSVSLFLHNLIFPEKPLSSQCPVPPLDKFTLEELLPDLMSSRVVPERIAWLVHNYVYQLSYPVERVTSMIMSMPVNSGSYICQVVHGLYRLNLVQPVPVLQWLINSSHPNDMKVFYGEILTCFRLLKAALKQEGFDRYLRDMRCDLISRRSELITFQTRHRRKSPFYRAIQPLFSSEMLTRANKLRNLLYRRNAPSIIGIYDAFEEHFPHFDLDSLTRLTDSVMREHCTSDISDFIFELFNIVCEFPKDSYVVSCILARIIARNQPNFPLNKFISYLYENSERIHQLKYLFFELQYHQLISYQSFLKYVSGHGYTRTRRDVTQQLLSELPMLDTDIRVVYRMLAMLGTVLPENTFAGDLKTCLENPKDNLETARALPFSLRTVMVLICIEERRPWNLVLQLCIDLDVDYLLTFAFEKYESPVFDNGMVLRIVRILPVLQTHSVIEKFTNFVFSTNDTQMIDAKEIIDHFREMLPSPLKEKVATVAQRITENRASFLVDGSSLVRKYSPLLDLFLHEVMQLPQRSSVFCRMLLRLLKNVIVFGRVDIDEFRGFFRHFLTLDGVALADFVVAFSTAILSTSATWTVKPVSRAFVKDVLTWFFLSKYAQPVDVLLVAYPRQARKVPLDAAPVVSLIAEILSEHPSEFTPNVVLSKTLVSRVNELNSLVEILQVLKKCLPLIVTQDIRKSLNGNTSLYAAALFCTLPDELFHENIHIAFSFFWHNVTIQNVLLWIIWLKKRPMFTLQFPVSAAPRRIDEGKMMESHIETLIGFFKGKYENMCYYDSAHVAIVLRAWHAVCDINSVAGKTVLFSIHRTQMHNATFLRVLPEFIHPALIIVPEELFAKFCNTLCGHSEDNFDEVGRATAMACLIYSARFAKTGGLFVTLASRLLHVIGRMYQSNYHDISFVIDCFNYMIAKLSCRSEEEITVISESLVSSYEQLPEELRDMLLVLRPPQCLRKTPEKPLYVDDRPVIDTNAPRVSSIDNDDSLQLFSTLEDIF